jgi:tRNA wybutosine-synthesizing protein 2
MSEDLVAVVEKPRAQAVIGSLRAEGVYDDSRSTVEAGGETVAIPVT